MNIRRRIRLGHFNDLSAEALAELAQAHTAERETIIEELLRRYEGMLWKAASRNLGAAVPREDALQEARAAFVQYIDSYDQQDGSTLGAYLKKCVNGSISNLPGRYQSGFVVAERWLSLYWVCMNRNDSFEAAKADAVARGMSASTFVMIYTALRGVVSLDALTEGADDYDGYVTEAVELDDVVVADGGDAPDLDITVWEAMEQLTDRQHACLSLWARGLSTVEIGKQLGIAQRVAHRHVHNALDKLRGMYGRP